MLTIDSIPEDRFGPQEVVKGSPLDNDKVLDNIRLSANVDVPIFKREKGRGGNAIFVAAGPSLRAFLPEIKKRHDAGEFLITCNHTYDYLQEHGIVCDVCMLIDPRPDNWDCVKKPQPKTTFYVATVCDIRLFENLLALGANVVKMQVAYGMKDEVDVVLQKEIYHLPLSDYLVGGTMTPLRAMPFAVMIGIKSLEFYGFDSCFTGPEPIVLKGEPKFKEILKETGALYTDADSGQEYVIDEPADGGFFYAFKKPRPESITVVLTPDNRRYLTTPGLGNQARQICKWVDRLEGTLDVKIHGDSLSANLLSIHRENVAKARAAVGDRRWSEEYAALQGEMHAQNNYGRWGDHDMELISRMVCSVYCSLNRPVLVNNELQWPGRSMTMLDYGAGNGALGRKIESMFKEVTVTNYDPFHPAWGGDKDPGMHDVASCCDVMEHVEVECVDNVLKYVAERTRYAALFTIGLSDATKMLPNGRNAHITLKTAGWWINKLNEYFIVVEGATTDAEVLLMCQKQDAKQQMEAMAA